MSFTAAYVSVVEPWATPCSSRYPTTSSSPCHPWVYWPRAVSRPMSAGMVTAESTFSFSARRSRALNETGSSIAVRASSWRRWFWMTSRAAPMPS